MSQTSLRFVDLTSAADPLLLPWLDLFETAFAPAERVLVSTILQLIKNQPASPDHRHRIQTVLDAEQSFAGMLWYELIPADALACLWYIATPPALRSQGYGSLIYQEVARQVAAQGCQALVFEVEIPALAETADLQQVARRRIQFYRRNGAYLLTGIHYLQVVGWHQPPLPMHVMVHPLQPQLQPCLPPQQQQPLSPPDPLAAFAAAKLLFAENLTQTGPLALE